MLCLLVCCYLSRFPSPPLENRSFLSCGRLISYGLGKNQQTNLLPVCKGYLNLCTYIYQGQLSPHREIQHMYTETERASVL